MDSLWPWLTVACMGALHGLNPASGWIFAAAWGLRSQDRVQSLRALLPIAVGHAASVGLVAMVLALGLSMDRAALQPLAAVLLVAVAIAHLRRRHAGRVPAGHAGLAIWSFMVSTAHGAGLMLVPAMASLCLGDPSTQESVASGPLAMALAVVGVHTAAMLAAMGAVAFGVCSGTEAVRQGLRRLRARNAPDA